MHPGSIRFVGSDILFDTVVWLPHRRITPTSPFEQQESIVGSGPFGYGDFEADCGGFVLKGTFSLLADPSGQSNVWPDDATEEHSCIARGPLKLDEMTWACTRVRPAPWRMERTSESDFDAMP